MDSVAAWKDGDDHLDRPGKKQRRDDEHQLSGKKKGVNFFNFDRLMRRNVHVDTPNDKQRSWEKLFDRLVEYKTRYGDSNVPVYFEDRELVAWVAEQRKQSLNGSLPPALRARLEELDFVFTDGKTKGDLIDLTSEESKTSGDRYQAGPSLAVTATMERRRERFGMPEASGDRNQATAGSSLSAPADAESNRRYERFGIRPLVRNPYAKSASRFTPQELQGWRHTSRFASSSKSQTGVSFNFSRLSTAASKTLPDELNSAPSSPQTILEKLRPHPPTPEIANHLLEEAAVVSPRVEVTREAPPEVLENADNISTLSDHVSTLLSDKVLDNADNISKDNISTLSSDKEDDAGSFSSNHEAEGGTDEAADDQAGSYCERGRVFLLGLGKGASNLLLRVIMMLRALSISFHVGKAIGSSNDIAEKEDIRALSNDGKDDEGTKASSQEEGKESVPDEVIGGKVMSSFTDILRKSGMILRFCLYKGCSILVFCGVMMLLALGLSTCLGVVMGYLILLGKLDVPAVNDILKARFEH